GVHEVARAQPECFELVTGLPDRAYSVGKRRADVGLMRVCASRCLAFIQPSETASVASHPGFGTHPHRAQESPDSVDSTWSPDCGPDQSPAPHWAVALQSAPCTNPIARFASTALIRPGQR